MKNFFTKGRIALLVIFSVLIIDQVIKVIVKTHMYWHESIRITDWFYIYFTENNGMAFGLEIFGKLFLTSFRIVAVGVIGWFLYKFIKHGMKTGFIVCVSLILTGALGNIIDSVFYGVLFNESTYSQLATLCPKAADTLRCSTVKWSICSISYYRNKLACVDAVHRWRPFHLLQPDFQLCRCGNQLRYHSAVALLQ